MTAYQQTVRRLAVSSAPGVTEAERVDPYARGTMLAAKVMIFGTAVMIPPMLGLLAIIGIVMLLAGRLGA